MTKVVFQTATIADALRKAEMCAPRTRADAFASSGGIVIEVNPNERDGWQIRIRSTNDEIFYDEWVDCISIEGHGTTWRVSSDVLAQIMGAMPVRAGAQVSLWDDGGLLHLAADKPARTKGKISLIPLVGYPEWAPYGESETAVVEDLGMRISQVSWASDPEKMELGGVFFTGTHLVATDRAVAAMVPCEIPIVGSRGVNVSAKDLGRVIKHSGAVRVGVTDRFLNVSPDDSTQIRCRVFDVGYPDVGVFARTEFDSSVTLEKEHILEIVKRMSPVAKGMDVPLIKMMLGGGEMNLRMEGSVGSESIEDAIPLPGQANHFPVLLKFSPRILTDGIGKAPNSMITLRYNSQDGKKNPFVNVDGDGGYRSWFVQTVGFKNDGG